MSPLLCIGQYNESSRVKGLRENVLDIQRQLKLILKKLKVDTIVFPRKYMEHSSYNILWVRDIFVNLDNDIQILKCDPRQRGNDHILAQRLFRDDTFKNKSVKVPQNNDSIKIEGGDIIEYKDIIFVGLSKRTNAKGIHFLKSQLATHYNKKVIVISHNALHLDCVFNILPCQNAIIYNSSYIPRLNKREIHQVADITDIISIDSIIPDLRLNTNLLTNYIFIYPNHIIISFVPKFQPFYDFLKQLNYNIHFVRFSNFERFGGSIRCFTQWIITSRHQILL